MTAPIQHEDGTVVSADPVPVRVTVRLEFATGAHREFTADQPADFAFAIAPSDGKTRSEPRIALMFAGNPDAGGIQVHQEGVIT